ncbi:P-loop NTPase fold protein [Pseudomonas sp. NPDC089534]|uniref:P-loop NTPase fold protein n=1 Tax=Pseudomonas sp. NPDC089534 TaxID=3364468 RepID=UPI003801F545
MNTNDDEPTSRDDQSRPSAPSRNQKAKYNASSPSSSDLREAQQRSRYPDQDASAPQENDPNGPPESKEKPGDSGNTLTRGEEPPVTRPGTTSIAITQNDDPWASDLDDRLGANDEAKAFARLAVAKDFIPPLAIGLFGNWGSGKSFFMRLIYQHIERLSQGKASVQAPEAGSTAFHTDVVQIRFNAWHYVETNLWASLVSHLFIELDRWYIKHNAEVRDPLLEHLSTSRMLTLDAAKELVRRRRDQRAAAEQLLKARQELAEVQANTATSPSVYLAALSEVFNGEDPGEEIKNAKDEFAKAAKVLGIDALTERTEAFQSVSDALHEEAGKAKLLASGYKSQLLSWWNVGAFVAIVLALPWIATEGVAILKAQFPSLQGLHDGLMLASVAVAAVTARLRWVWGKARGALKQLEAGKRALDKAIDSRLAEQKKAFEQAVQRQAKANAGVEEAKALVQVTSEQLALATHDFSQGTGAGRLKKFVRARATDGDYAQHLGLIATVRKDFEELAFNVTGASSLRASVEAERSAFVLKMDAFLEANKALLDDEDIQKLRAAAAHSLEEVRSFKRIALYIDDLDRCPPDKVVEVLQAVHLLLTFPLFVVMVAVDVRWVRQALLDHYPNLMAANGEQQQTASVSDYLEKIFQIPYWMRPMDSVSSEQFLQSQLSRIKGGDQTDGDVPVADGPGTGEAVKIEDVKTTMLSISPGETDALQLLARYMGSSPRRALRFLNVYRLIKVSLKPDDLAALEAGEYKALLTLLAIALGTPLCFSSLLQSLDSKNDTVEMSELKALINFNPSDGNIAEFERFREIMAIYTDLIAKQRKPPRHRVKKYTAIIQRYSFDG